MLKFALFILMIIAIVLPVAAQSGTYTVEYGDILDVIAAQNDASVACIAEASGLENPNKMRPGDVLRVPGNCPAYDGLIVVARDDEAEQGGGASSQGDYTVVRGDVLDSIAARYNVSVNCLAESNNLGNPHRIFIGDTLDIDTSCPPYGERSSLVTRSTADDADSAGQGGGGNNYLVLRGDVLDLIAAHFNVQVDCLADANELENPHRIYPGDSLTIDRSCPAYDGEALNT